MTAWTVREENGRAVVSWGRRSKTFPSLEAAMAFIRKQKAPRDSVVQEEEDGYRTPLTRRRWRGASLL